ncbi:hypothetical protein K431DRAFT_213993 [Polychaeton citri CBS 116435]|uniref:Developmental regulatory protein wetA n=1 Tax=Polychaeton citri CBS 116435 TaxID=1314669 RepID=A0A9P4QK29_9PEZI|nr:hypothetical protein K431DRAFT_213993 [Polychaeton citri CBS 116435]
MTLLKQRLHEASQNRPAATNRAPDWSSLCNNVFDEYVVSDDFFALADTSDSRGRINSDHSLDLFDFSAGSEQSNGTADTAATSPILTWSGAHATSHPAAEGNLYAAEPDLHQNLPGGNTPVTDQPEPKKPLGFWGRTLKVLERTAAKNEDKQHKLRVAKSHPDFLSLGGYPSPPAARPASPTEQTLSVQRRRAHASANGSHTRSRHRATSTAARSVSRGRPTGITKHTAGHAHASSVMTAAASSLSPQKMMNPSRYRAGFKEVWTDKLGLNGKNYELSIPPSLHGHHRHHSLPRHDDFVSSFETPPPPPPAGFNPLAAYDEPLSPLTTTFQQAKLHTPHTSPHFSTAGAPQQSYFEVLPLNSHVGFEPNATTLDGGPPVFPERSTSLATGRIQQFDFGFSSSPEDFGGWNPTFGGPSGESTAFGSFGSHDHVTDFNGQQAQVPATSSFDSGGGLGISGVSCNLSAMSGSSVGSNNYTHHPDTAALPLNPYHIPSSAERSTLQHPSQDGSVDYYGQQCPSSLRQSQTTPSTPHRRRSFSSASPPAATGPISRNRRDSSRSRRATSRHRRVKSTNCTPRSSQHLDKGGFVNFTPQDSNKILSGVAPSGSSKTKARREKEAADKRRRLSQAAMKAVVEAGGDIEALQKAGLLA